MKTIHAPQNLSAQQIKAEIARFAKKVRELLDQKTIEEYARGTGFVERQSKLTGHLFLSVFTFGFSIYGTPTLTQLVGLLNMVVPELKITRQGLHDRIDDSAVAFFEKMLSSTIALELPKRLSRAMEAIDSYFRRIFILDSTSFQLPKELVQYFRGSGGGGSEAAIKITFGYDIKAGEFFNLISDGVANDSLSQNGFHHKMDAGDLEISDLGFFNIEAFAEIDEKGAFYLSRLRTDVKVYQFKGKCLEEFDLCKFAKSLSFDRTEVEVYLKKGPLITKTRLIIERVPDEVKATRLSKQNQISRKKGHTTRKRVKTLAGFNLYITNASAEKISGCKIRLMYTIRWQIELVFKSWKSNFALAEIAGKKAARIKCMIYAKLIWIFITTKITHTARDWLWLEHNKEVSCFQAAKYLKTIAYHLLIAIIQKPQNIPQILVQAMTFIKNSCVKSRTRKRKHPLELLQELRCFLIPKG